MTESSKFHIRTKLHEFQDKITRKAERDRENNDDGVSSDGHTEASDDDDPSNSSNEVNEDTNDAEENNNDSNGSESNDGNDSNDDSDGDDNGDDEKENCRAYLMMATSSYEILDTDSDDEENDTNLSNDGSDETEETAESDGQAMVANTPTTRPEEGTAQAAPVTSSPPRTHTPSSRHPYM